MGFQGGSRRWLGSPLGAIPVPPSQSNTIQSPIQTGKKRHVHLQIFGLKDVDTFRPLYLHATRLIFWSKTKATRGGESRKENNWRSLQKKGEEKGESLTGGKKGDILLYCGRAGF